MRNPSIVASFLTLTAVACTWTTSAGFAAEQTAEQKHQNLLDDIAYSRDIARYRYFDLAVEWLATIEKRPDLDAESKSEVLLAKATIARLASDYALTRAERQKYFDEGIKNYTDALASMDTTMNTRRGEAVVTGLASLLVSKGKFYSDDVATLRSQGKLEEMKAARTTAEEAFKEAVKTLNAAVAELDGRSEDEDLSEADKTKIQDLALFGRFHKGEAYYTWAMLYENQDFNREDYLKKTTEVLEEFIWSAGDENFFTVYAYYYMGMAEFELGRIDVDHAPEHDEKSLASLTHIFSESGIDFTKLGALGDDEREFVQEVAEKAYLGVCQLYRNAATRYEQSSTITDTDDLTEQARKYLVVKEGDTDPAWKAGAPVFKPAIVTALRSAAVDAIDRFEKQVADNKLTFGPMGHYARLEKARAMADRGDASGAMTLVKDVVEKNADNIVGYDGGILLAELSQESGSGSQPPSVLTLIAQGFVSDGKVPEAIAAYHQVIAACKDPEDAKKFGAPAWLQIGRGYDSVSRFLEASLAYEEGMAYAQKAADEESLAELATSAYSAWDRRFRETKDEFDQNQRNRVRKIVTDLNLSADLQYFTAREAYSNAGAMKSGAERDAAFKAAQAEFQKVAEDSQYYERALVFQARCVAATKDVAGAIKIFEGLFARAKDPKFATALDKKKDYQRDIALAEATFYQADALLNVGRFDEVLKSLDGYETKYAKQSAFYSSVELYRLRALVGLKRFADAEALVSKMASQYPNDNNTTNAYAEIAKGYYAAFDAIKEPTDEKKALERKTADYFALHNERTGFASFTNLKNVALWYSDLGELKLAEDNFRRLFDKFGKNPAQQKELRDVKHSFAATLNRGDKFADAEPIWRDVFAFKSRDRGVVREFARCLGGYLREEGNVYKEITGVGKFAEARELDVKLLKGIEDAGEKNSADYWQARVDYFFHLTMEGRQDPNAKEQAKKLFANWEALNPELGGEKTAKMLKRLNAENQR